MTIVYMYLVGNREGGGGRFGGYSVFGWGGGIFESLSMLFA